MRVGPLDAIFRKRIGEFHYSYDNTLTAFWVAALTEATALKDHGKNSSATAETHNIDFFF